MKLKHACVDAGQYGVNVSPAEYREDGIRMIRTSDLGDGKLSGSATGVFLEGPVPVQQVLLPNDLLLSRAGTIGRSYLAPREAAGMTFAGFLVRFRPSQAVDPRFLQYAIRSKFVQEQIMSQAVTSTIQNFNADRYANLELPDVGTDEQRRIADFLDDRVSQIEQIINARLGQAGLIMDEVNARIAAEISPSSPLSSHQAAHRLRAPEQGSAPRVSYLMRLSSGSSITSERIEPMGDYPVYGANGIRGFTNEFTHRHNRILIGRQGALCGNVVIGEGPFWASEHALVCEPLKWFDPIWMAEILHAMNLGQYSQSAAQPGISAGLVESLRVPWVDYQRQREIGESSASQRRQGMRMVRELERSSGLLTEYKTSLITAAVTGELDVSTAGSSIPR